MKNYILICALMVVLLLYIAKFEELLDLMCKLNANTDIDSIFIYAKFPLIFFKNIFNLYIKISRKLGGLYIRFLYFCITSFTSYIIFFTISTLILLSCTSTTSIFCKSLVFGICETIINAVILVFLIKKNNIRKFISKVSNISETLLLKNFTYQKVIKLVLAVVLGIFLGYVNELIHDMIVHKELIDYIENQKSLNLPINQTITQSIYFRPSGLKIFAQNLDSFFTNYYLYIQNIYKRP